MEPRKSEKPEESRGEGQTSPPSQPERKRRFQIVKLEERIAPRKGGHSHALTVCDPYKCYGRPG
jgi:hypothetical protein